MATNTLHNALCITLNLFKNLRLRIAIVHSAWRQPNISKHTSTVSCDLVLKNFPKCAVYDIVNGLIFAQRTGLFCAPLPAAPRVNCPPVPPLFLLVTPLHFRWHANDAFRFVSQVPKHLISRRTSPTTACRDGGRQMDRPARHGRPPVVGVPLLQLLSARQRRRPAPRLGSRTQFPPLSDEARSDPAKMIIHRLRAALIWAAVAAATDAAVRDPIVKGEAVVCIGTNRKALNYLLSGPNWVVSVMY